MADDLRARIDAAIRPNMLIGLQDAELHDEPGKERINEWADWISRRIAELFQPELDELGAKVTALEASYEVVAADAMAHGLCSLTRHSLLQRAEKAEAEVDRLTAELHRHAACAVCGHERHRHGYEPIIRRDWCGDCPTANDLHTFKEA